MSLRLDVNRSRVLALLVLWTLGCGSGRSSERGDDSPLQFDFAPTAVIVPAGREHVNLIDAASPRATLLCLNTDRRRDVEVQVEFDDSQVRGEVVLFDAEGVPVDGQGFEPEPDIILLHARGVQGRPAACVRISLSEGTSVFRMRWTAR